LSFVQDYSANEPSRQEVDGLKGATVLEFGNTWCGYCRRATPLIEQAFTAHDRVGHIRVADGSGRPLGRSFGVKLWPTLVFLRDGKEIARLVRPDDPAALQNAFDAIDPA
jgi:thioredoxin 1